MKTLSLLLFLALPLLLVACAAPEVGSSNEAADEKESDRDIYTKGRAFPDMSARRPELRPEAVPARVRYVLVDDATVNAVADQLDAAIQARDTAIFGDTLFVLPGAWDVLKVNGARKVPDVTPISAFDLNSPDAARRGAFASKTEAIAALAEAFFNAATSEGGYTIRALRSGEMAEWWPFIPFDIEEPLYVVETEGGRYRLIVSCNREGEIGTLDELKALPVTY
ncbi:MAG: hypothetical protein E1N59_2540 [Puniceicoccaceae bacterium 5H]|nr:MAG: hypothetical protein E1N59_2540 [Puniceicoccaceae bacterium 5H]